MAGDWIKFEVSTPEKQEVLAITVAMGWDDPDLTVGKLLRVWRWFDQHTVDGNGHGVSAALLDRIAGVTGFASAMEKVGWLSVTADGIELSNFGRHNGETAKSRALTAKRVAKHKANAKDNEKGNGKGNAATVTAPLPKEEKRREEEKDSMSGKPDGVQAGEVLDYLNAAAGKSYRKVETNLKLIRAKLESGVTVADCKAVIDVKVAEWGNKPEMEQYLRPETLFGARKFEQYLGQLTQSVSPVEAAATADGATFIPGYGKCY